MPNAVRQGSAHGTESPGNSLHCFPDFLHDFLAVFLTVFAEKEFELHSGNRHNMIAPFRTADPVTNRFDPADSEEQILSGPRNSGRGSQRCPGSHRRRDHRGGLSESGKEISSHTRIDHRRYRHENQRQRENEKAKKKREKARRRADNRARGASEPEYISAEEITGDLPSIDEAMAAIADRKSADRRASTIPCKLFVGSLSRGTSSETLRVTFEKYGPVSEAIVITDRTTGDSRGFGFVTMSNRRDGAKVIEDLDGYELEGRNIVVKMATER